MLRHEHLQELKKQVDNILLTLTNRQREVIYLKFYEDLTYEEIADMLQMQAVARLLSGRTLYKVLKALVIVPPFLY